MWKNVSNELYCKTADFPKMRISFFSGSANGTSTNAIHSAPTVQFDHWITRIKSNLQEGSPWRHFCDIHCRPLTFGNEAENKSVLYRKLSSCPCNMFFTAIFIQFQIFRKSWTHLSKRNILNYFFIKRFVMPVNSYKNCVLSAFSIK